MKAIARINRLSIIAGFLFLLLFVSFKKSIKEIPKTWDIHALEESHLPPPGAAMEIKFAPESYYYSLREHIIYKTYPFYAKEFEPPGYLDSLKKLDPVIVFDEKKLTTQADWIKAGEKVFSWPASFSTIESAVFTTVDSAYLKSSEDCITGNGIFPFYSYVIREKGKVEIGRLACSNCHTRVTGSGDLINGAQGNHSFDGNFGYIVKHSNLPLDRVKAGAVILTGTPLNPGVEEMAAQRTRDDVIADLMTIPPGVMTRQGMSYNLPIRVPSLIGIKDIKYLDHTGLMRHRGPADIMRYAALNQGMDLLISYNGFIPGGVDHYTKLPDSKEWRNPFGYAAFRYSDAQLYALAQYIYSLQPPKNPNHFPKDLLKRGESIFIQEGCVTCHTPPLYTNNMLTPVDGFEPPQKHFKLYDIFNVSVETDPASSLTSRRSTGYYKIPSLRGVWYRGPFFHNGELATLEDVLDPARLKDDYVPTGFKPAKVETKAVKGHDFGLDIPAEDKKALIAFLKSL